ncbi:hypothetical protein L2U69_11360 [Zavarzinia compransoris]|uniref:hypothetical protein n=1 Tax=Zavarzinia marina TaxID=2911065 RepID=UPI001F1E43A3|nr:hypothetical protein [Zavarzinia marina]MCF4166244.1 hypothetical protein [Zavarzinia marina]
MPATLRDAEKAIKTAIMDVQALGELPYRPVIIDAAVKSLTMYEGDEHHARDLVARALADLRQRGVLHSHDGAWNIWTLN